VLRRRVRPIFRESIVVQIGPPTELDEEYEETEEGDDIRDAVVVEV
jgi:hypothetical protein